MLCLDRILYSKQASLLHSCGGRWSWKRGESILCWAPLRTRAVITRLTMWVTVAGMTDAQGPLWAPDLELKTVGTARTSVRSVRLQRAQMSRTAQRPPTLPPSKVFGCALHFPAIGLVSSLARGWTATDGLEIKLLEPGVCVVPCGEVALKAVGLCICVCLGSFLILF